MNTNFVNFLKGINTDGKYEAVRMILHQYSTGAANDSNFYSNEMKLKRIQNALFDQINTTDQYLESLIKLCAQSPYNIFIYLMNEDWSDIIIHRDGVNLSDGLSEEKWVVPAENRKVFHLFVRYFVTNVVYLSNMKFDPGNNVLDADMGIYRFNLIHESLNNSAFPVIVVRKQVIKPTAQISERYVKSLGCSQAQLDVIHKHAKEGNVIIFGEVGSGKTTLLKYMGMYGLEEKRNLCIIEDTSELNIPVPISLVTNNHSNIKDLFIASLRENPSHVIIGETRTDEIVDILEAALTMSVASTIHANSFVRAIQRIIFMSMERKISSEEMENLINASVDCFIFMEKRKVKEVWVHKPGVVKDVYEAFEKIE